MLKQELDQYTNNIKKSSHLLLWKTSKTTSQILISQITWQAQVCLKLGKNEKISNLFIWNKEEEFPKIKFSSNKQGREENVSAINENQ